ARPDTDVCQFYKVSALQITSSSGELPPPPPWCRASALEVYRGRGHRRLDVPAYEAHCLSCIWGCQMPVDLIVESAAPAVSVRDVLLRAEVVPVLSGGSSRRVPGRRGMTWVEENWIDEEATAHRGPDD